jgi:Tol biopolymer transport system component
MRYLLTLTFVASVCMAAVRAGDDGPKCELVFSVKTWNGDYTSKDVAGGVETTPVEGAIYTIRADGSGLTKIVALGKNTDNPAFSPDGRWIYFQSNVSGRSHVYRCSPDGKNLTVLTDTTALDQSWKSAYGYALSRDGRKMVYTVHDGQSGRIVLANADGGNPQLLFSKWGYVYMAALSPAADRVVASGPARGYRLLIADLPDGQPRELTPEQTESFVPQFTPDGNTIIFLRRDGDIYRVDLDGKNLKRLTTGNRYVEFRLSDKDAHGSTDGPQISKDGRHIAYIARKDGAANVWVMTIDGRDQRQITKRPSPCGRVRWSPDGTHLAFVSFEGKYPQLFIVSALGGEPRRLSQLDGGVNFIDWK